MCHVCIIQNVAQSFQKSPLLRPKISGISEKYIRGGRMTRTKHFSDYRLALEIHRIILCHKLNRDVEARNAGFFIQPNLFCLVAVPSSLISDKNISEQFGIVFIKYPRTKQKFRRVCFTTRFLILCREIRHWFTLFEAKTFWRLLWRDINVYGFIRCFLHRLFLLHFQWTFDSKSIVWQGTLLIYFIRII